MTVISNHLKAFNKNKHFNTFLIESATKYVSFAYIRVVSVVYQHDIPCPLSKNSVM